MESVGDILTKSKRVKRQIKPAAPLTAARRKFLDVAEKIIMNPGDAEPAFMARELVQCTMPHTDPGNIPIWKRKNGNLTLAIQQGYDLRTSEPVGYPYGTLPRLLLFWMTTEAVRTKNRRLELGHSLSSFMRELGLIPASASGGKRSDAKRLQQQMRRLLEARISFLQEIEEEHRHGERRLNMEVAPKSELWWNPREPEQGSLWGSYIILGEYFFEAITALPVPADMRVLKAIKKSPLALDLYVWATWRVYRMSKPAFIPWQGLMQQVGAEYSRPDHFVEAAKGALRKIRAVYPALKLSYSKGGFMLHPSPTAIAPAPKRVS